jgi:tRNA-Thr(GGU) m(6)t(6)A37 methyltransferase TsaA
LSMETGVVRFIGRVEHVEGGVSTIVIRPEFCQGLMGLEMYGRVVVLYWFHERDNERHRSTLQVVPRRHGETELRGVFASHSPSRPNPVGLTEVELLHVEGCTLTVRGLDAFEGSPVVDIKPLPMDHR